MERRDNTPVESAWERPDEQLTPGQLHLFRELLIEFADQLDGSTQDAEWTLATETPNLLAYIGYKLERLRQDQEHLEKYWRYEGR